MSRAEEGEMSAGLDPRLVPSTPASCGEKILASPQGEVLM